MAKRKRLAPSSGEIDSVFPKLEAKSALGPPARAPIAQVAGEASAQSALNMLADEMAQARKEGLFVQHIPLGAIREDHLVRDRMVSDADEMDSLTNSLRARGQQTPIEVVDLGDGQYGLVSGWRRVQAFRELQAKTNDPQYDAIAALIKPIDSVSDSYVAMVEENEIRANLSFYERAHLAVEAAKLGVYTTPAQAVTTLFANTTPARRSKIKSFVRLHEALGPALRFPAAIPEHLGLALVSALDKEAGFAARLRDVLRKVDAQTVEVERAALERAVSRSGASGKAVSPKGVTVAPDVRLEASKGRLVLSGKGVTDDLRVALTEWFASRKP